MKRLPLVSASLLCVLSLLVSAGAADARDTDDDLTALLLESSPSVESLAELAELDVPPVKQQFSDADRTPVVSTLADPGVSLVGALALDPFAIGVHADVNAYGDLAFVGKWTGPCPGTGVDIIDISDPAAPVKLADTTDHPGTSMEDVQAIRIGDRDVLATGLQNCAGVEGEDLTGLELFDISDPADPQFLSFFEVGAGGVHEFDLTATPDGRVLALLAVPNLEALTATPPAFTDGLGDVLIVDISDPDSPELLSDWGVLAEPALGVEFYLDAVRGEDPRVYAHSARANADGTLAYLSYWDAGYIILDISDPTEPVFLGRTEYPPDAEGNAHSVAEAHGGSILIGADEDFSPFRLDFQVTGPPEAAGEFLATEATFTVPIADLPGQAMEGEVVYVGRGCPPGTPGIEDGDPYLADPEGKIALIGPEACRFDNKIAWAQLNGAVGVIVHHIQPGLIIMAGDSPVAQGSPEVIGTEITIPGIFVEQAAGQAMLGALDEGETVTVEAAATFTGWGFLRFFDISDPTNPVEIATFATENTFNPDVATEGTWSVHNPEVLGDTLYASWYNDGVRVIDISDPADPHETAFWVGEDTPPDAPPVDIWSVVPHQGLLVASDRNFGLYVLEHVAPPEEVRRPLAPRGWHVPRGVTAPG